MCSLRFENNFLTFGQVRFRFENSCLAIERVRFASKIIFLLSKVFASLRYRRKHHYRSFRSLSFRYLCHYYRIHTEITGSLRLENNFLTIEFVRFASIQKKTPLSKFTFAFRFHIVAITTTIQNVYFRFQSFYNIKYRLQRKVEISVRNGELLTIYSSAV